MLYSTNRQSCLIFIGQENLVSSLSLPCQVNQGYLPDLAHQEQGGHQGHQGHQSHSQGAAFDEQDMEPARPSRFANQLAKQLYHVCSSLQKRRSSSFKKYRKTLSKRIAWPSQAKIWGGTSLWEGRTCQPKLCSQQPGRSAGGLISLNSDTMKNKMIS